MDWLDLLGVQGILESLLQHHSSKASIFWQCGSTLRGRKGFAGWLSIFRVGIMDHPLWALKGAAFILLRRRRGSERTRSGGPEEGGAEGSQGCRDGTTSQQMPGK